MSRAARLQLWLATITGTFALVATGMTGAVDVITDDPPQRESCIALADRTLDFAKEHPGAARVYAKPGRADLTPLAEDAEVSRCGDPEILLERLHEEDALD